MAFQDALPRLFSEQIGGSDRAVDPPPEHWWHAAQIVLSDGNGYLQRIDEQQLIHLAVEHDLCCKLDRRPGEFVPHGSPLMRVQPPAPVTPTRG